MPKPLRALLGILLVIAAFLLTPWQISYVVLSAFLLWMVSRFAPRRYRRHLLLAWCLVVITLFTSTALQSILVRHRGFQSLLQRFPLLDLLAGGPYKLGFWAFLTALVIAIVVVWAALQALAFISAEWVLSLSSGLQISAQQARKYVWDLILQQNLPSVIVDDGQAVTQSPAGILNRLGGPGLLIIRPGNAVIVEAADGTVEIHGPGTAPLKRLAKIKEVVDLRPQENAITVTEVLTKERIPLKFQLNAIFQIEPQADTDSRPDALMESKHVEGIISGPYTVYKETVFKAGYHVAREGWKAQTIQAITAALRDVVFGYGIEEIYHHPVAALAESRYLDTSSREKGQIISALEQELQQKLAAITPVWGVRVTDIGIATIEAPAEIHQTILTWWQKKWEAEIAKQDATKEATLMMERAAARRDALIFESEGEAFARAQWLREILPVLLKENQVLDNRSVVEVLRELISPGKGRATEQQKQMPQLTQPTPAALSPADSGQQAAPSSPPPEPSASEEPKAESANKEE